MSWHRMQRTFSQISVAPSYEVFSSLSLPTSQSQASGHTSSINVPDYERPPTAATKGLFHPLAEHDSIVQADVVTSPTQSLCPDVSLQIFGAVVVFLFCKVKPSSTCQQFTFAYSFFSIRVTAAGPLTVKSHNAKEQIRLSFLHLVGFSYPTNDLTGWNQPIPPKNLPKPKIAYW